MIKDSQTTQSKKFAISLQHFGKEVRNGSHFWHAGKRQSFYQVGLILFGGSGQTCPMYPK